MIHLRNVKNEVKMKRFKYNILYLSIFLILLGLILISHITYADEKKDSSGKTNDFAKELKITAFLLLARVLCEIGLFIVRLSEPGVRKFLKDKIKRYKRKLKTFAHSISLQRNDNIPPSYLNYTNLIDELKQKVRYIQTIEYQLAAISILILDNYSRIPCRSVINE